MRIGPMSIVMLVIYLMIGIFDQALDPNLQGYGNGASGYVMASIFQPWNWSGTITIAGIQIPSLLGILGAAITIAVGIALIGSVLGRSDIVTLFALFGSLMSLGAIPCIVLYNFVSRNVGQFAGCVTGQPCAPANVFGGLTAGILAVMWIFTCMEWWGWRATTQ
jgi:hypothetical protein